MDESSAGREAAQVVVIRGDTAACCGPLLDRAIELTAGGRYSEAMSQEAVTTDPLEPLAARFREGDRAAFNQLYSRLAPGLLAFLKARASRHLGADDLLQDVWVKAWRSREKFQDGHFKGWLYAMAHRLLIDASRRRRAVNLPEDFDPVTHVEHSNEEGLTFLKKCLDELDGSFAAVVREHLSGFSTEQIADRHGIQTNTVYSRFSRGKELIRTCLERKLA